MHKYVIFIEKSYKSPSAGGSAPDLYVNPFLLTDSLTLFC